jgi:hypothetical protein
MSNPAKSPRLDDHDEFVSDFLALANNYAASNGVDFAVVLTCAIYQLSVEVLLSDVVKNHLLAVVAFAANTAYERAGHPVKQSTQAGVAR